MYLRTWNLFGKFSARKLYAGAAKTLKSRFVALIGKKFSWRNDLVPFLTNSVDYTIQME